MSFSLPRINVPDPVYPDLAGAQQRGQQFQANQLAMLAQRQQFEDAQAQRNAFAQYGQGLASSDPTKRQNVLSSMMQAAPGMGQQLVPMMRDERDQAAFASMMGGGAPPAAPVSPAVTQTPLPPVGAAPMPGQFLTQLRRAESGGNDGARNPNSSASGRFQITNGTFAQYAPRLGLTEADRNNPEAQQRVALAIQADGAQALGRPLQGWEQYGAHFLGLGGLRAFSNADPNADALTTYTQAAGRDTAFAAFRSNPGLLEPGMTVGQVREALARRVPGEGGSAPPAPPPPPGGAPAPPGALPSRERLAQIAQLAAGGNQYAARYLSAVGPLMSGETQVERIRMPDGSEQIVPRNHAVGRTSAPAPRDVQTTDVGAEGDRPSGRYVLNQDGTLGRRIGPVGNPGQQVLENARAFRTELSGTRAATDYNAIEPRIMAIRQAAGVDTRAADLDLVFAFANLLDPGSVVREGEALIVARTGALDEQLVGALSRVIGGAALGPETRAGLVAQAESRFATFEEPYRREVERVRRLAARGGVDPDLVADPLPPPQSRFRGTPGRTPAPGAPPPPGSVPRVPPPPPGQRLSPEEAALLAPNTPFTGLDGIPRVRQ